MTHEPKVTGCLRRKASFRTSSADNLSSEVSGAQVIFAKNAVRGSEIAPLDDSTRHQDVAGAAGDAGQGRAGQGDAGEALASGEVHQKTPLLLLLPPVDNRLLLLPRQGSTGRGKINDWRERKSPPPRSNPVSQTLVLLHVRLV